MQTETMTQLPYNLTDREFSMRIGPCGEEIAFISNGNVLGVCFPKEQGGYSNDPHTCIVFGPGGAETTKPTRADAIEHIKKFWSDMGLTFVY